MFFPFLLLTILSASGLLLYTMKRVSSNILSILIALGAGSMISISLIHIFPESLEVTENAVYAFVAGFVALYIIEEFLTPHTHDHAHGDHSHEDPHEHYDHVALTSFIALFTHTLLDGLSIRAGMGLSETVGYAILFGVGVHQIPVSLSLGAILRESKLERKTQIILLCLFALAAPIGYFLGDMFLANVSSITTGLAAAFAGGSLLYVATADLLPMIHSQTKRKYPTLIAFLIGCIFMAGLAGHSHAEEDSDHGVHTQNTPVGL